MCSRCLETSSALQFFVFQDVFKTAWGISARRLGRQRRPTNVCWVRACVRFFRKRAKKKGQKNVLKIQQSAKYMKIWAKMYKI